MAQVLLLLALHVALTAPVMFAGAVVAHARRPDPLAALVGALLGAGLVGYGVGLVWYASPTAGIWASRLVPVAALVVLALVARRDVARTWGAVTAVAAPFAVMVLNTVTVLGVGLLWRAPAQLPLSDVAAMRFSWRLPTDNTLPLSFLRHVELRGHAGTPPSIGDWLPSDRPPLQSALLLSHVLTGRSATQAGLDYQVGAVLLQSWWVIGLWIVLAAFAVRRSATVLAVAAGMSTSVIVLNTFFVWPKLLATGLALGSVGLVLLRDRSRMADGPRLAVAAALAALAYLAHGGVMFVLVPVAVLGAVQALRGPGRVRTVAGVAVTVLVLLVPWTLYQKTVDPPGDRLLKWMLAEVHQVDPRPVWTVVSERYQQVGWSGALTNKWQNLLALIGGEPAITWATAREAFRAGPAGAASWVRVQLFYVLGASAQLLLPLALGWLRRGNRAVRERVAANRLLLLTAVSAVFWCLVLFGPATTILHQGTYALVLLLTTSLVLVGHAAWPRITVAVVLLNAVFGLVMLVPLRDVADQPWTAAPVLNGWALATALIGLALLVLVLVAYARGGRGAPGRHSVPGPGTLAPDLPENVPTGRTPLPGPESPITPGHADAPPAAERSDLHADARPA